jgi:hypothetical protein
MASPQKPTVMPKLCMFCRLPNKMSSEHVWGEWVQDHVPRTANKHHFAEIHIPRPGEEEPAILYTRAGDPINSQVGGVCEDCNNRWMSALQEAAKPHLIPLFKGEKSVLTADAQKAIATWIAMATMTGERMAKNSAVTVPQLERDWLMNNRVPPDGTWRVWIGRCSEPWRGQQWVRTTSIILDAEKLPNAVMTDDRVPNTQATAFKIGKLYIATFNCPFSSITQGWDWRTAPRALSRLQQIWPIIRQVIVWPAADMTAKDASFFATAYKRYSDDLARSVGFR